MSNTIQFPSESQRDEMEFETMKEFEYTSYDMFNIYLHWGKERGLRAETEPAGDKIILKVNENGDKAWIYIKEWNGTEHKYILEPKLFPMLDLVISDDVNQLVKTSDINDADYIYLHYILGFHTEKTIEHNKDYIKHIKEMFIRLCKEYNYSKQRTNLMNDLVGFNIIEKFD